MTSQSNASCECSGYNTQNRNTVYTKINKNKQSINPCKYSKQKLNDGTKIWKIEWQFFSARFKCPSSLTHNFPVPFQKQTVFELLYTRAGNSLICSSLVHSFAHFAQIKWATVSDSLISLKTNERLWVNRLGRSRQMSNSKRFAQVPHDKWANEQLAKKIKNLILKNERFAHYLNFGERCERIGQVAHQKWALWSNHSGHSPKWANMSEWLRSLRGIERAWAKRSGCSPKMSDWANCSLFWVNRSFAHFLAKNERFAQKTNKRIPSPALNDAHTTTLQYYSTKCFI